MNKKVLNIPIFFWVMIFIIIIIIIKILLFILHQKKEIIKIGAIIPITGPGERLGVEAKDGMMLAIDEVNLRNGINGRKIELIIEDSKSNVQESKKAFMSIEKAYKPIFYITALSSISMALAPLAEENQVVQVGLMVATMKFPGENKWSFRFFYTAENEAESIILILQTLKVKRLGIIYLNDEYGISVLENIKKGFSAADHIVRSDFFEIGDLNYKAQIEKLKNMEAIYFVGLVDHIKKAFMQLRELKYNGFILSVGGASDQFVVKMPEANGVYIPAPFIYSSIYLYTREVQQKYEEKFNKSFNLAAANGYDCIIFLASLLNNKEISRESIKAALEEGFFYHGVLGTIKVKPGEHEINFPICPARIVDGKIEYLNLCK